MTLTWHRGKTGSTWTLLCGAGIVRALAWRVGGGVWGWRAAGRIGSAGGLSAAMVEAEAEARRAQRAA